MNILNLTGINEGSGNEPDVHVGTPENPVYLHPLAAPALTGNAARQSTRDRFRYLEKAGKLDDPDLLLPSLGRQERRAQQRGRAAERRKATRRHLERQRAADFQANHLAQMFNLDKGLVLSNSWNPRLRARDSINRAVKTIIDADHKRFDREFNAWARDGKPSGRAPQRPMRHEEARAKLEEIALGARTRVPKEKWYDRGNFLSPGLSVIENRTGVAEIVTTGRTGRAG
jgi:hypothetical protein